MATGVWSWSTTAASNDSADASINWTEGQAPSTVNNSARAEMAGQAKYLLDAHGALTTTGAANTYSVATNSTLAALRDGVGLSLVLNATSTGASTLNVDGLGAKAIRKITGAGEVAIAAGDVVAAGHYIFNYDESANSAAGAWILLNPAPSATAYLSNVVEDTTPQLGGDLDPNGNGIAFTGATVTDVTGADTLLVSGTAGTNGNLVKWNTDGDVVDTAIAESAVLVDGDIGGSVQAQGATLDSIEGLTLAAGDILYATAADTLVKLAKGTAAQALVMNAGATAPEWASPTTAGWTQIADETALPAASVVDITGLAGYEEIEIIISSAVQTTGTNRTAILQVSDDNGATFETTGYNSSGGASEFDIYDSGGWDSGNFLSATLRVVQIGTNPVFFISRSNATGTEVNAYRLVQFYQGDFDNGNEVTALRISTVPATNFTAGTYTVRAK